MASSSTMPLTCPALDALHVPLNVSALNRTLASGGGGGGTTIVAAPHRLFSLLHSLCPSLFHPDQTLPQWLGLCTIIFTLWWIQFFTAGTPKAILREHLAKKNKTESLAEAALAYTAAEMTKKKADRKLPESERTLLLPTPAL